MSLAGRVTLSLVVGAAAGCSHVGNFVWVDEYKEPVTPPSVYVISPGDVISIRVWNQEGMSGRARVRTDGKVSLPFINDIDAADVEPSVLARRVQARLKEFIVNPIVTISLEEPAPFEVSVIGQVGRPGVYRLERDAGVAKVLASAGGLSDFAKRDRIFVVRSGSGAEQPGARIRFTYESVARGDGAGGRFRLRSGDLVVVE